MGRRKSILASLHRVLELGERVLESLAGELPPPEVMSAGRAFRWESRGGSGRLTAIEHPHQFDLSDLIGVDRSLERLIRNTEQFVRGLPSNHALLYGERGTGKSSAVKGLLSRFGAQGLRLVEVHRDDLIHLPRIQQALRPRPERFLIFCDDLSFAEGEVGQRELKAALEGTLEAPPSNVRIIATSNRRHLMPEHMSENRAARLDEEGELHLGEALEEKLALSDRFGLILGFYSFDQATYLRIVDHYMGRAGMTFSSATLHEAALRWALDHSSRSGRTAKQFVDDRVGREGLERGSPVEGNVAQARGGEA